MVQPQVLEAVAQPQCKLISGGFALAIQGCCGLLGVAMLVLKRAYEQPQRPWITFGLDVSKQGFGGVAVHFANIGVSILLPLLKGNKNGVNDECAMYFLNFFIDCTIGVGVVYVLQQSIKMVFKESRFFKTIGDYGKLQTPTMELPNDLRGTIGLIQRHPSELTPMLGIWVVQLAAFLSCLAANKILVALFIGLNYTVMNTICNTLFAPVQPDPKMELVIVMVCCPGLLTLLQFYLFDHILKKHPQGESPQGESLLPGRGNVIGPVDGTPVETTRAQAPRPRREELRAQTHAK